MSLMKASLCFCVVALLLASATTALGTQDPELKQCQHQCRVQQQFDKEKLRTCVQQCEDYIREKHSRGGGSMYEEAELTTRSPIERLRECSSGCSSQGRQQQQEDCYRQCQVEYEREKERYEGREEKQGGQGEQVNNPYVFEDRHFFTGMQTQHGRLRILPKFTDRSELFRGIHNYRVAILEAQPQAFIVPNHWDADSLIFVANGRGSVSLVHKERRESFNIKQGDLFRIKAGTTTYMVNRDNNERLVLAKLIQPVNTPGQFEAYFGAGGENPESFYRAFSNEILEAAFNVGRDRVQRMFGQQSQGVIIKASKEQVRAMSQHEEGGIWPFRGGESKGTINLYEQRPTHSNQYGQLFEVDSSQFSRLQDLDVAVSLANITQGSMTAPYYNSKSTKITIVVDGEGYFEMACPHLGSQEQRQQQQGQGKQGKQQQQTSPAGYQRVSSRLRKGTVTVVPAGHPFVAVASKNQNLQLLCFEIKALNNEKFTLAGKRNVMSQLEREAKELAFGMPAREVDEVFGSQQEDFFFRGPNQGRSDA